MPTSNKRNPELQLIERARLENTKKSQKITQMEYLVHDFDVQKILLLNDKLRKYYTTK